MKSNLKTTDDIIDELLEREKSQIDEAETKIKLLKLLKATMKRERHRDAYGVK